MSAKIIEFLNKDGLKPHHRKEDVTVLSEDEIFQDTLDKIIYYWVLRQKDGTLNDFIHNKLPAWARAGANANYVQDYTTVRNVEEALGYDISMLSAKDSRGKVAWSSKFAVNGREYKIEIPIYCELSCRMLTALVFIELSRGEIKS